MCGIQLAMMNSAAVIYTREDSSIIQQRGRLDNAIHTFLSAKSTKPERPT